MLTTRIRSSRLLPAAALVATGALLLSACGGTDDSEGTEAAQETAATSAEHSPLTDARTLDQAEATMESPGGVADADTNPKSEDAPAGESQLVVTDIRVGEHAGKDRVVFELAGDGTPGYEVSYEADASQQGSGNTVDVPGEAKLQVMLSGQTLPMNIGETEVPVGTVSGAAAGDVAGVAFAGQFEGRAQSVIGVNGGEKPFSAFLVENPTRLVVDIER